MKKDINTPSFTDYNKAISKLYLFLYPLLEAGWNKEEVYNFVLFMEKNQKQVKGKELKEILKLYLSKVVKKEKM